MYGNRNNNGSMYDIKESSGGSGSGQQHQSGGSGGGGGHDESSGDGLDHQNQQQHHRQQQRHRRQGSSSSFSIDPGSYHVSFSSLENFMQVSRHMQDEIMLPTILRDKHFDLETQNTIKNMALQDHEFMMNDEVNSNSLSLSLNGGASSGEEDAVTTSHNNHLDSSSSSSSLPSSSLSTAIPHHNHQQLLDINSSDVLDHYKFVLLVRSQFTQHLPFLNIDEHPELKYDHFRLVYGKLRYHYREMMNILDSLSSEAKAIMDIYKENI